MGERKHTKCIADAETVTQACWALASVAGYSTDRKGVVSWPFLDMKTGNLSRLLYGVKAPSHPDGLIFNHCPFCGEKHPGAYSAEANSARAKGKG